MTSQSTRFAYVLIVELRTPPAGIIITTSPSNTHTSSSQLLYQHTILSRVLSNVLRLSVHESTAKCIICREGLSTETLRVK
jgi:hypothetical protein